MSMRQRIECPKCKKFLFEAIWVSKRVSIVIVCRCQRILEVTEEYRVNVLSEDRATHQEW
jgi:hypothetical protein